MRFFKVIVLFSAMLISTAASADETLSGTYEALSSAAVGTEVSHFGINTQDAGMACTGAYYNWGKAQNGFGYCYEWACNGSPLNGGQPVSDYLCESRRPSYYDWGKAQNGWGYCYQYTPYGVAMNKGQPVGDYLCESRRPSYYSWARSQDGRTRCYQYTPYGVAMNKGQPVSDYLCR